MLTRMARTMPSSSARPRRLEGNGFADVFKRGHFGWEYKGTKANLDVAFAQLQRYAIALDNPPLLIVSDIGTTIRIHTNWTNTVSKVYEIAIAELADPDKRGWLKSALSDPEALRPSKTRQQLTEQIAGEFAQLARSLRERGHKPEEVAHFINRLVFCMFAEDVNLLPNNMFTRMLDQALVDPAQFESFSGDLFAAMKSGGRVGFEMVEWFNGGLFNDDLTFALTSDEIRIVQRAAQQYWGDIDPSILGTLFERGLDPDKRSQLGAHYTDRDKIMMIVRPVVVEPLLSDWRSRLTEIEKWYKSASEARARIPVDQKEAKRVYQAARRKEKSSEREAVALCHEFLERLRAYRVLDPACGSGNFLYLALHALKDIERLVAIEMETMALTYGFTFNVPPPMVGPSNVLGIELNPYAAELARVSIWIGEIQWMIRNGFDAGRRPILKKLDSIECGDALMTLMPGTDGEESHWVQTKWPRANAIIGNPPFLGGKLLRSQLGDETIGRLFKLYAAEVPAEADLVTYWIERGRCELRNGTTERVGFVATNSVRGGANRRVLGKIADAPGFLSAWSDEPWTVEGAAVRVSLITYGPALAGEIRRLNGSEVEHINSDLSGTALDFTKVRPLYENNGVAFMGDTKGGSFEIPGEHARQLLQSPRNPNGRSNADVLRPWANGLDLTRRWRDKWIIDFGWEMTEEEASLFEKPFEHVERHVRPARLTNNREHYRKFWWRHVEARPGMWAALRPLSRMIATPEVSRYRVFAFLPTSIVPDHKLQVIARDDDTSFGILASRIHLVWSLKVGNWHGAGNDPRYTISTCFMTFPFPQGLTPNIIRHRLCS